jgi:DNA-binding NtrC family response regulator
MYGSKETREIVMLTTRNQNPVRTDSLLTVSGCEDDHQRLREIFADVRWNLISVRTIEEAIEASSAVTVPVLICEQTLPDGDWRTLLGRIASLRRPPRVVVCSRLADEPLWAEVLNVGGWDLLAKPFLPPEVFHVVSSAWESWRWQWNLPAHDRPARASAPSRLIA